MKPAATVCIVDDDPDLCAAMGELLTARGWRTETFGSGRHFLRRAEDCAPDCVILDVDLPDMTGLQLQERFARAAPTVPIIFLTAHADIPMSVRAMKAGAAEFLTKPVDPGQLVEAIQHGIAQRSRVAPTSPAGAGDAFVGASRALRKVTEQIALVAPTDATVLITGESGTGKELVARALHEGSQRRRGPFIKVNCSAIPDALFESEFFGHVKGAFTGALRDRPGRFELADRGTLFLDEICELPRSMQAKLLRVLQEKEVERVGDTRPRRLDVRIIAATNRDFAVEVELGNFRADLFYRLGVFPIENPALRDRREDIPLLAQHFIHIAARRIGRPAPRLSEAQTQDLLAHDWPGNVRELQNTIERAVILACGGPLRFDWLKPSSRPTATPTHADLGDRLCTRADLKRRERESTLAALAQAGGKVAGSDGAAALLGIPPSTLYSRLTTWGWTRPPASGKASDRIGRELLAE